jgi:hypothetical protein
MPLEFLYELLGDIFPECDDIDESNYTDCAEIELIESDSHDYN